MFPAHIDFIVFMLALNLVGKPYKWGGNAVAYDCSGLVLVLLRAGLYWPNRHDTNSQGLYTYFSKEKNGMAAINPRFSSLIFYGKSKTKITHIAFSLDEHRIIEAAGGDQRTKTIEDALRVGAEVRINAYNYRSDIVGILNPIKQSVDL